MTNKTANLSLGSSSYEQTIIGAFEDDAPLYKDAASFHFRNIVLCSYLHTTYIFFVIKYTT